MNKINQQVKYISKLLPKIARNLRIAPLIDAVKPGLTTSQLMILLVLMDMKDAALPIGNLTQELAISFPSVTGIIDRLYKENLVERTHSEQDRRLVLVKLTDEGKEIADKLMKSFEELLFTVFEKLPETEQKSIMKSIESVFTFSDILSKSSTVTD